METQHVAPIRTSHDLIRVIASVLKDISAISRTKTPHPARFSPTPTTRTWFRTGWLSSFDCGPRDDTMSAREPEVADKNEPDVVISAVGASVELAIEVKHGGKPWTVADLEHALAQQLATDYLRTQARRSGILVITNHRSRTWRAPENGASLRFGPLISRLNGLAETLTSNPTGPIKVQVVGIDATAAPAEEGKQRDAGLKSRGERPNNSFDDHAYALYSGDNQKISSTSAT